MRETTEQLTSLAIEALERRGASACIIPIPGTHLFVAIGLPHEIISLICTKGDEDERDGRRSRLLNAFGV